LSAFWSFSMKEYKRFYETMRLIALIVFPLLVRLRVSGRQNVPKDGPMILVGNHLNWTDIPLIGLKVRRRTHFMAKAELFQKAPSKWLWIGLGAFPVRRGEPDRQAIKQAEEVLKAGQVLVIFPEGTRSKTHMMKEGLPGAALIALRSGAPVVPVGIYGSEQFKLWHVWPFRTPITITYGTPFTLSREGRKGHSDLQSQLAVMMRHIADLLPPQYQGKYALSDGKSASDGNAEPPALVVPAHQAAPAESETTQADTPAVDASGANRNPVEQG
jgi:1-acyl-sn-glycerol-3-phosphate acyltransferase